MVAFRAAARDARPFAGTPLGGPPAALAGWHSVWGMTVLGCVLEHACMPRTFILHKILPCHQCCTYLLKHRPQSEHVQVLGRGISRMPVIWFTSRMLRGRARGHRSEHLQDGARNRRQVLDGDVHAGRGMQSGGDSPPPRQRKPPRALDPLPIPQPASAELSTSDPAWQGRAARGAASHEPGDCFRVTSQARAMQRTQAPSACGESQRHIMPPSTHSIHHRRYPCPASTSA